MLTNNSVPASSTLDPGLLTIKPHNKSDTCLPSSLRTPVDFTLSNNIQSRYAGSRGLWSRANLGSESRQARIKILYESTDVLSLKKSSGPSHISEALANLLQPSRSPVVVRRWAEVDQIQQKGKKAIAVNAPSRPSPSNGAHQFWQQMSAPSKLPILRSLLPMSNTGTRPSLKNSILHAFELNSTELKEAPLACHKDTGLWLSSTTPISGGCFASSNLGLRHFYQGYRGSP
ncbi:hypothetical protein TcWFU_002436 [Taenia crassiceps]|uniref:Uncharacterized protein n=1 Tax=Taenia crassiceps TaxID=6207 RepID=A0ABR4Q2D2_9CEST